MNVRDDSDKPEDIVISTGASDAVDYFDEYESFSFLPPIGNLEEYFPSEELLVDSSDNFSLSPLLESAGVGIEGKENPGENAVAPLELKDNISWKTYQIIDGSDSGSFLTDSGSPAKQQRGLLSRNSVEGDIASPSGILVTPLSCEQPGLINNVLHPPICCTSDPYSDLPAFHGVSSYFPPPILNKLDSYSSSVDRDLYANNPSAPLVNSSLAVVNPNPSKRPGSDLAKALAAIVRKRRNSEASAPSTPLAIQGQLAITHRSTFKPASSFLGSSLNPCIPRFSLAKEAVLRSLGVDTCQSDVSWLPTDQSWGCKELVKDSLPPQVLRSALFAYAEAVAVDDKSRASILQSLLEADSTPQGSPVQRVAHLFLQGLQARVQGSEIGTYVRGVSVSACEQGALWDYVSRLPCLQFWMEGVAGAVYEALEGHEKVHIVDFGGWAGQWPQLIRQLAKRPGGPPSLRFTAVFAPAGLPCGLGPVVMPDKLEEPIRAAAQACGVPLQWQALYAPLEEVSGKLLQLREGEVVAVNCALRLAQLMDDGVLRWSPRDCALRQLASLSPAPVVVVQAEMNLDSNAPFFLARVREAFDLHCRIFATQAQVPGQGGRGREVFEREVMGKEIINLASCEGANRLVRHEKADSWQRRMWRAGIVQREVPQKLVDFLGSAARSRNADLDCQLSSPGLIELLYRGQALGNVMTWQPFSRALLRTG